MQLKDNDIDNVIASLYIGTIKTNAYSEAQKYVKRLHATHKLPKPKIGLLIGASGIGKSVLTETYADSFPDIQHSTYTEKRIIYIKLTARCSLGNVYKLLYTEITNTTMPKMDNGEAFKQIVSLCIKTRVQLIIIDEAQQVLPVNQTSTASVMSLADAFKNLIDDAKCAILLSGMPNLEDLLKLPGNSEEISQQLKRRSVAPHRFAKISMDETQRVLINIQSKLAQLGIEYDLNTEDMLLRFFIASKGVIASIFEILAEALRFSDGDITYKAFEDTFNFIKGSEEINPFLVKSSSLGNLCAEVLKKIDGHEEKKESKNGS